jgi:hypothetical protein
MFCYQPSRYFPSSNHRSLMFSGYHGLCDVSAIMHVLSPCSVGFRILTHIMASTIVNGLRIPHIRWNTVTPPYSEIGCQPWSEFSICGVENRALCIFAQDSCSICIEVSWKEDLLQWYKGTNRNPSW